MNWIGIIIAVLAILGLGVLYVHSTRDEEEPEEDILRVQEDQRREFLELLRRQGREARDLASIGKQALAEEAACFANANVNPRPATHEERLDWFFLGLATPSSCSAVSVETAQQRLREIHRIEREELRSRQAEALKLLREERA